MFDRHEHASDNNTNNIWKYNYRKNATHFTIQIEAKRRVSIFIHSVLICAFRSSIFHNFYADWFFAVLPHTLHKQVHEIIKIRIGNASTIVENGDNDFYRRIPHRTLFTRRKWREMTRYVSLTTLKPPSLHHRRWVNEFHRRTLKVRYGCTEMTIKYWHEIYAINEKRTKYTCILCTNKVIVIGECRRIRELRCVIKAI